MAYKKKKGNSGFLTKCGKQLRAVRKAKKASSRNKTVKAWQQCLVDKHGLKAGVKPKKSKK